MIVVLTRRACAARGIASRYLDHVAPGVAAGFLPARLREHMLSLLTPYVDDVVVLWDDKGNIGQMG